jgi:anaerobic ribonucleoside-triphosphate reductase
MWIFVYFTLKIRRAKVQKDKNSGKIKVFTLNQSWEDIISDLLANGIYLYDYTLGREIQQTKNECNKLDTIAFDLNDTSQRVMSKLGMIELKKVTKIHIHGEIYLEDNPFFVIGRELTEKEKLI